MDNNSAGEQSHSSSQGRQDFEQDEVVWAKIQGYPWWPAYIGSVEAGDSAPLYKVYFFGDNSHSRLNLNKLRKFEEFFQDFAPLAKKNSKLKSSLAIAQAQLQDNHEDVSYFEIQSTDRKNSHLENKPSENGSNMNDVMRQENGEVQPVKRRPGRPRKIRIQQPEELQNIKSKSKIENSEATTSKNQKIEEKSRPSLHEESPIAQCKNHVENDKKDSVDKSNKQQNKEQIKEVIAALDNIQLQKKVEPQHEPEQIEEVHNNSQQSTNKKSICKQIRKARQLMSRNLFRQAYKVLSDFKIDPQNILDVLDLRLFPTFEQKLNTRGLLKFKQRIKKALIDKYFRHNYHETSLHHRNKRSLRGKTVRRMFGFLKKVNPHFSKQMALAWQQSIRKKNLDRHQYMQSIIQLLTNANIDGFIDTQMKQERLT